MLKKEKIYRQKNRLLSFLFHKFQIKSQKFLNKIIEI